MAQQYVDQTVGGMVGAVHNLERAIFATENPQFIRVLSRHKGSERLSLYYLICGFITCDPILLCQRKLLFESFYLTVHENRVEINSPHVRCCKVFDDVRVFYFDRTVMQHADRAGFCSPYCTHNECFPTCCDLCGEGVVLHGTSVCCDTKQVVGITGRHSFCICIPCLKRDFIFIHGIDNADEICNIINQARDRRLSAGTVVMQPVTQGMMKY